MEANNFHDFVSHRTKRGSRSEYAAVKTVLGQTLYGPYLSTKIIPIDDPEISTSLDCELMRPSFFDLGFLERLWTTESIQVPCEPNLAWIERKLTKNSVEDSALLFTLNQPTNGYHQTSHGPSELAFAAHCTAGEGDL